MKLEENSDYERVARAIRFMEEELHSQPNLEEIAAHLKLSPHHFHRLFARWAGTTPRRFLQALTLQRGKSLMRTRKTEEVADSLGLSSPSRLHDHFVQLEAVTPGQYRKAGEGLDIAYGTGTSPFGPVSVAFTGRGICKMSFVDSEPCSPGLRPGKELAATNPDSPFLLSLRKEWPGATFHEDPEGASHLIASVFASARGHGNGRDDRAGKKSRCTESRPDSGKTRFSLFVQGTNFQISVWKALLEIPEGSTTTYAQIARSIGSPSACRAVGNAVAANPVAFLIPCHRVILGSGATGNYRWGQERKRIIQAVETAGRKER